MSLISLYVVSLFGSWLESDAFLVGIFFFDKVFYCSVLWEAEANMIYPESY